MAKQTYNIDTYLSIIILETYALTLTRVLALCSARKFHFIKLATNFYRQPSYLLVESALLDANTQQPLRANYVEKFEVEIELIQN